MKDFVGAYQPYQPSRLRTTAAYGAAAAIMAIAIAALASPARASALDLSPVTNTLDNTLNKPLNSLPVVGPAVAKTTDTLLNKTVPGTVGNLTQNLPVPLNNTLDTTVKKLDTPLQKTTDALKPVTNTVADTTKSLTDNLGPVSTLLADAQKPVDKVTDTVQPLLGDTLPATADTVANKLVPAPVNTTLRHPLQSVMNLLQPVATTAPRPGSSDSSDVLPHVRTVSTTIKTSGSAPSNTSSASSAANDDPSFFRALPQALQKLADLIAGKHVNALALAVAASILGIVIIVFFGALYRMIAHARLGLVAINHDFATATTFYRTLLTPAAVAFGTLATGSVLIYLVLIGF